MAQWEPHDRARQAPAVEDGDESLGQVPNAHPSHLEAWLVRLRDRLRNRIFASTRDGLGPPADGPVEAGDDLQELPATIGRYQVLSRIGSGGMGFIVAALDPALGRKVAVKLLHPAETSHPEEGQARLLREAQALARLSHPGVIHVYEVGTHEDRVYVAMEFVEGTTLRRWQLDPERTWRAVLAAYMQAGEGLAAAHRVGIVHRDFKPDNVLVRAHDRAVRVIDFGLARTEAEEVARGPVAAVLPDDGSDDRLTRSGAVVGTPAYMAPEQFKGKPTDARTDQFAFCVALYEALYGYRPFAAATVHQLAHAVLDGKVEPPPRYTDVPPQVYRVLLRGLSVEPAHRFPTMDALLAELPSESPRMLRWATGSFAAVAVTGLVATWIWADAGDAELAELASSIEQAYDAARVGQAERMVRHSQRRSAAQRWNEVVLGAASQSAVDDATRALGLLARVERSEQGWLPAARLVASQAVAQPHVARQIPAPAGVDFLAVAEGGQVVAWASVDDGRLHRRHPERGHETLEPLPGRLTAMAMAPRSTLLVAGDAKGNVRAWTMSDQVDLFRHAKAVTAVAVGPDGELIVSGSEDGTVHVQRGEIGESLRLGSAAQALALSSDGTRLAAATADGGVYVRSFAERKWRALHRFSIPLTKLQFMGSESLLGLDERGRAWRLQVLEHETRQLDTLGAVADLDHCSDSTAMILADLSGTVRLFDGSESRALRVSPATKVAMSSDGRHAAVAGNDGEIEVWTVEGPAPVRRRVRDGVLIGLAHSRATSRLAAGTSSGAVRVWQPSQGTETALGHLVGGARHLQFSPQGDHLAAIGGSGGLTIWTMANTEGPRTLSPAASVEPPLRWSEDGTALMSQLCDAPQRCAVVSYRIDDGKALVSSRLGPTIRMIGPSVDGRRVVTVRRRRTVEVFEPGTYEPARLTWSHGFPGSVMGLRPRVGSDVVRIATHHGETLTLWDWAAQADVLVELDTRPARQVLSERGGQTVLIRADGGDELWDLREPLPRPLQGVPDDVEAFEVDTVQDTIALYAPDAITVLHVPTGVSRTLDDLGGSIAWRGGSSFVQMDEFAIVFHEDPTPADPEAFFAWLARTTDATADLDG